MSSITLERIGELMRDGEESAPPKKARGKGTVEVWTHIVVDEGIELTIEPERAGLSPEEARGLLREIEAAYRRTQEEP